MKDIKVLIVDDSVLYRSILSTVLSKIPGVTIVDKAPNGKVALEKMEAVSVDLVTLDVEMPVMDGIQTLEVIKRKYPDTVVLMVSAITRKGASTTLQALEKGAFDVIAKPEMNSRNENEAYVEEQMKLLFHGIRTRLSLTRVASHRADLPRAEKSQEVQRTAPQSSVAPLYAPIKKRVDVVAIGASTGGPNALAEVIPKLPGDFRVPVLIVQHMPPVFTTSLAESLNEKCSVTVTEAKHGDLLKSAAVFIAPGGKQMRVARRKDGGGMRIEITDEPPENHCKPSVDYLFRSVAREYQANALAVILTGMGRDGTVGLRLMKRHNVHVIGQSEMSCVVYGMPGEAKKAGVVDIELSAEEIASEIVRWVG